MIDTFGGNCQSPVRSETQLKPEILANEPTPMPSRTGWNSRQTVLFISAVAVCLFAIRLAGPPNLLDQDQQRPGAYVLDAVNNGNWLCQRDLSGDITSKPPFYTWLASGFTWAMGRISEFTLYLPGALALLGSAVLLWRAGRKFFNERAAIIASLAVMLTTAGLKDFGLARTDGVFSFTVTAAALIAFGCWNRGGGWIWFWLAAAVSTLTKGPLGLVLAGGGVLAAVWERRRADSQRLKGSHWAGIALFFLLTGGWFVLSYWQYGQPVIDKLIGKELVGNAIQNRKHSLPGTLFWQPPLFYLGRAAPWSLFAYYGFWRLWKNPAVHPIERRFERFLFCWFFVGLIIFSISPHQRADLLWPIMPAGALIAGREISRFTRGWTWKRFARSTVGVAILVVIGFGIYYLLFTHRQQPIRETVAVKQLARAIEREDGNEFPITHVDDPAGFQIYLNTLRPQISVERAATLLRGSSPAFVATRSWAELQKLRNTNDAEWFTLLPGVEKAKDCPIRIMANRPDFKYGNTFAFCFGSIYIEARGVKIARANTREFAFTAIQSTGEIMITNESSAPDRIRIRVSAAGLDIVQERTMTPGEIWRIPFGPTASAAK